MKLKIVTAALIATILIPGGAFGLDLTPHQVFTATDGPPVPRYYFQDHDKRLSFRTDGKMTVTGSSSSATFAFQDFRNANMRLMKSPLSPEQAFDDKIGESYRASARALLPSQATDVKLETEKAGAIVINGWSSQQYNFLYNVAGVPYSRSVTFINFSSQEQLVFDVAAPTTDYVKIYARSYHVLNSLSEMPAFAKDGPT